MTLQCLPSEVEMKIMSPKLPTRTTSNAAAADDNLTNVSQALASGAGADFLLVAFAMNKGIEMKDFLMAPTRAFADKSNFKFRNLNARSIRDMFGGAHRT